MAATIGNEEVHAFRVALRRLRSWLRAARTLLQDDIPRRERTALQRLAREAGAARDAQVQWQWLTAPSEPFGAPAARAAQWLADTRRAEYAKARERLQHRAADRWPRLASALAAALGADAQTAATPSRESLAEHLAPVLARHLTLAQRALDRIEHRTQVAAIHRARIKVKRLRYLVEAIDPHSRTGMRTVRHLRALQDALGELHDAHVLELQVAPLLARHSTRRRGAPKRPSLRDLRALRAALRRRELAAFRRSLDLAAAPASAALWRASANVADTLLRAVPARQVAATAAEAPRALAQSRPCAS